MPINSSGTYDAVVRVTGTAVSGNGSSSGAAPTLVTDGVDISDADGFRAILAAASSQTLSGSGSIIWWLWDPVLAVWCVNSALTNTLSFTTATYQYWATQDYQCTFGYARVYAQMVNVASSSGNVTPYVIAGRRNK